MTSHPADAWMCHVFLERREVNNDIDFVGQGWATGALGSNKAKNCWAPGT